MYLLFEQEYKNVENPDSPENIAHIYGQCRNISIDFGIMEKCAKVYVMKGEFGWSDVALGTRSMKSARKTRITMYPTANKSA